ncbi:formin-like protein 14 [Portunus trituberculatus]|uniref:formin-like protein 14 n=1 Tax=Portunus trituberculatus TaxID=210409 RepID=UPI001E1CC0CF|nr:formin-like protein 14 [Portunus trituberculatus]
MWSGVVVLGAAVDGAGDPRIRQVTGVMSRREVTFPVLTVTTATGEMRADGEKFPLRCIMLLHTVNTTSQGLLGSGNTSLSASLAPYHIPAASRQLPAHLLCCPVTLSPFTAGRGPAPLLPSPPPPPPSVGPPPPYNSGDLPLRAARRHPPGSSLWALRGSVWRDAPLDPPPRQKPSKEKARLPPLDVPRSHSPTGLCPHSSSTPHSLRHPARSAVFELRAQAWRAWSPILENYIRRTSWIC